MRTEMENPGAGASAAGAEDKETGRQGIIRPAQPQENQDQQRFDRGAWLDGCDALTSHGNLTNLAFRACYKIKRYIGKDGRFFIPYETLVTELPCSRSGAANLIRAIKEAGVIRLAKVPIRRPKGKAGRASPTYVAVIVDPDTSGRGEKEDAIKSTAVDYSEGEFSPNFKTKPPVDKVHGGGPIEGNKVHGGGLEKSTAVDPNIRKNTGQGAGALDARPAPVSQTNVVPCADCIEDSREDGGALERAPLCPPASFPVTLDDLDRLDAEERRAGCAPEGAPAHEPAAVPDQDDEEAEEMVYAAHPQPPIDSLALFLEPIYDAVASDAPHSLRLEELVALWIRGFVTGIPAARIAVTTDTAQVITKLKRLARTDLADDFLSVAEFSRDHMAAIARIARKATGDPASAARAVEAYETEVGVKVARAMKMEVAHG